MEPVLLHVADRVATITLNRPDRLNAWTGRMHSQYRRLLAEAERDRAVRVIVVTGAGRGFCAGGDSEALEGHVERGGYDDGLTEAPATPGFGVRPEFDQAFAYHYGLTKPVIAKVNGAAAGVGLVLACFADLRFAASEAKLTTAAPKLGLPAEYGLSWVLPRLIGLTAAADLLLTGRTIRADEAPVGLFNEVVASADLDALVDERARWLAEQVSPDAVMVTKAQMYADMHRDIGSSVVESERLLHEMMTRPDYAEGVAAYTQRRQPRFADPVPSTSGVPDRPRGEGVG